MSVNVYKGSSDGLINVDGGNININDKIVSEDSTWSSRKINDNLGNKASGVYSTDEVEIGTYIGENLYRKCFVVNGTSTGEINVNIRLEQNLNVISLTGTLDILGSGRQYTFPVPYTLINYETEGLAWYRLYTYYDKSTGYIIFNGKNNRNDYYKNDGYKLKLIVEYTK